MHTNAPPGVAKNFYSLINFHQSDSSNITPKYSYSVARVSSLIVIHIYRIISIC